MAGAPAPSWHHTSAEDYKTAYEARNASVRKGKKRARDVEGDDDDDDAE